MPSDIHDQLCIRGRRFLENNGFSVSFDDRFQAAVDTGERPDTLGFRNGVSCLIEVKVTRADFLADKKKRFRQDATVGMGDWRFFLSPPDIILADDLPDGWGLLHASAKQIRKVHGWPPNTQWYLGKPFSANKQAECDYLYSALRRIKIAGHLEAAYTK